MFSIKAENLSKNYGDYKALNNLSFEFSEQERIGIIGDNGAGKSTLLNIIAGVSEKTSGDLNVQGRIHAVLTLGQNIREAMTGRENLITDSLLHGMSQSEADEKILEMIDFCDLGEAIDRPVYTYSSGMRSKIAFASLVFADPEILVIDEALSVGDYFFAQKASQKIRELCDQGRIVIIVSHSLAAIKSMCNRCIWIDKGKIIADGPPNEVISKYSEFLDEKIKSNNIIKQNAPIKIELETDFHHQNLHITLQTLDGVKIIECEKYVETGIFLPSLYLHKGKYEVIVRSQKKEKTLDFDIASNKVYDGGTPLFSLPCKVELI